MRSVTSMPALNLRVVGGGEIEVGHRDGDMAESEDPRGRPAAVLEVMREESEGSAPRTPAADPRGQHPLHPGRRALGEVGPACFIHERNGDPAPASRGCGVPVCSTQVVPGRAPGRFWEA